MSDFGTTMFEHSIINKTTQSFIIVYLFLLTALCCILIFVIKFGTAAATFGVEETVESADESDESDVIFRIPSHILLANFFYFDPELLESADNESLHIPDIKDEILIPI